MILEVALAVAVGAAGYEYFTNAKFKSAVQTDVAAVQAEVATLKTKATSAVAVAEADFAKVEAAVKTLVSKL